MSNHGYTSRQETQLESMVDQFGLDEVIYMLADVCGDKADHIAENWQDESLAKAWRIASYHVNALMSNKEFNAVSIGYLSHNHTKNLGAHNEQA